MIIMYIEKIHTLTFNTILLLKFRHNLIVDEYAVPSTIVCSLPRCPLKIEAEKVIYPEAIMKTRVCKCNTSVLAT